MDSFLKTDLHIHSSSCYSRNFEKKDFIEKIKNSELDVISITDHNVIDVELYKELKRECDVDIIGGVELNLKLDESIINNYNLKPSKSPGKDYFHAIMWFGYEDLEIAWSKLKRMIETKLEIELQGSETVKEISKKTKGKCFYLQDVQNEFSNIDYYLIYHEGKSSRNLSDYLPNGDENNEKFKGRLFYYNNSNSVEGLSRKIAPVLDYFERHLNTVVAKFLFSDAKILDEIGKRFTWILFDGSFQGLILPITDPYSRVVTSDESLFYPQSNKKNYLEKITFKDSDNKTKEICFSPGYNGVIGSRGSGKSMLASILTSKNKECYEEYFLMDSVKYKISGQGYSSTPPKFKYLRQNYLDSIFEHNNITEIDILKKMYVKQEKKYDESWSQFLSNASQLHGEEETKVRDLYQKGIFRLEDLSFLATNVERKYAIKKFDAEALEKTINWYKEEANEVAGLIASLNEAVEMMKDTVYPEYYKYEEMYIKKVEIYTKTKGSLKEIIEELEGLKKDILSIKKESIVHNENIKLLHEVYESEYLNKDTQSYHYEESYNRAMTGLLEIYQLRKKIKDNQEYLKSSFETLAKGEFEKKVLDTDVVKIGVKNKKVDSLEDIYREQYKNDSNSTIEQHFIKMLFKSNEVERVKEYFNGNKFRHVKTFLGYLEKYYENLNSSFYKLKDKDVVLIFDGEDVRNFSPGKQSEIFLRLFLNQEILEDDYTFVILDQPEDNLDTETITYKLVKRIKGLKRDIQVFIISHSASVIVNGDAENIIYAQNKNRKINYKIGTLLDSDIKYSVVNVLDGGETNLKIRFNKYNFNHEEALKK